VRSEIRSNPSRLTSAIGSTKRIHFGLADGNQVHRLTIRWPSGEIETFSNVAAGHHYQITQGAGKLLTRKLRESSVSLPATVSPRATPSNRMRVILPGRPGLVNLNIETREGERTNLFEIAPTEVNP
jgi:hypothetical protein